MHRYNSIVWQGPLYVKIMNDETTKRNLNYIVELGNNVGLSLALIGLKLKYLQWMKKILAVTLIKFYQLQKTKK